MNTIMLYFGGGMGNPVDMETKALEMELKLRNRKKDPELPPEKEPGDGYILLGTIIGLIAGGLLGFLLLASGLFSPAFGLFAIVGGGILGGILGSLGGNAVKKRINKNKGNPPQGPFTPSI
jgi:hypothetical protein